MKISNVQYARIVLTKKCNMSCTFCHQEGCSFNEEDIDYNLLIEVIKKLYEIGYRKIKLMGGEPMLYPQIKDAVCEIKRIGSDIDLSMISNGSAASEKYIELLENGLDRLNISVHGWEKDYFCKNTGNSIEQCERVKNNIFHLAEQGKINKINYVLQKGKNEQDFINMVDTVKKYNLLIDVLNLLVFPNQNNLEHLQYSFEEIETFINCNWNVVHIEKYDNPYSFSSKRLYLSNGCVINLKINKLNEQNIFYSCNKCKHKKFCIEGIKAIRLTNAGFIQPCLLRRDNTLKLGETIVLDEIKNYLKEL